MRQDLSKSEAKVQSLSIENDLLRAALENAKAETEDALVRLRYTQKELRVVQADHEYDADVNRGLVLELLDMLGKKARHRNKKRLREIRLAVAEDAPDFLDEIMAERGLTDADLDEVTS